MAKSDRWEASKIQLKIISERLRSGLDSVSLECMVKIK